MTSWCGGLWREEGQCRITSYNVCYTKLLRYGRMDTHLLNFDLTGADPMADMSRIMAGLRAHPPVALAGAAVKKTLDYLPGLDGLPTSDVLTFANKRSYNFV